jgi:hypothetical protein
MVNYILAESRGDRDTLKKMLAEVETSKDFTQLKERGGCARISSFSEATVIVKGNGAHRANFAAFPFGPMWGAPLYFGAKVK